MTFRQGLRTAVEQAIRTGENQMLLCVVRRWFRTPDDDRIPVEFEFVIVGPDDDPPADAAIDWIITPRWASQAPPFATPEWESWEDTILGASSI